MRGGRGRKKNPARFGGWMQQSSAGRGGWSATAPGGRGPRRKAIVPGSPQPTDRWGAGPAAAGRAGVGTAGGLPRPEGRALSPRPESDRLSTPFPPRNTFLAKSRRGRAMPPEGPPRTPRRRTGARAAPSPARPPSSVPLTQRPSRPPF